MPTTTPQTSSGWPPGRVGWISLGIAYSLAMAMALLQIFGGDLPFLLELPGALAFAMVLSLPPTLALYAMRRRSQLFVAAGIVSIALSIVMSVLGIVMIAVAVVWFSMYARSNTGSVLRTVAAAAAVLILGAASAAALFVHVDPRCADIYTDGTVKILPLEETAMESGWIWDVGGTSSGFSILGPDVVSSVCTSNVVTWTEAAVSISFAVAALGSGWAIATTHRR